MGSNGLKRDRVLVAGYFVCFFFNGLLWVRMNGNGLATGCKLPMGEKCWFFTNPFA